MPNALRREQIVNSRMYRWMQKTAHVMDRYYLDPLLGFVPGGVGDLLSAVASLPFVVFSLTVVKSLPLTLAVIFNILGDIFLGLIPYYVGNIIDFFSHSYKRNMMLIEGFVNDDQQIINEVNRKAWLMGVGVAVLLAAIIGLIWLVVKFVAFIFS